MLFYLPCPNTVFHFSPSYAKILPVITNPISFLKDVRAEMSKVTWLNREETIRLTAIVILASVLVALYIGGLDFVFTKLVAFTISLKR